MEIERILIVEKEQGEKNLALKMAAETEKEVFIVSSIKTAMRILSEESKWDRVIVPTHMHEGGSITFGSDIALLCQTKRIFCVMHYNFCPRFVENVIRISSEAGALVIPGYNKSKWKRAMSAKVRA